MAAMVISTLERKNLSEQLLADVLRHMTIDA
jgi:hypothetical protein